MMLGERIKEQRCKSNLSQERVAELVGISRQAVTKWESGQSLPSMANLITLSEILGVPIGELTGGENLPPEGTSNKKTGTVKLVFAIILAVAGIFAVAIISTMPPLEIIRIFSVSLHGANTVRLSFQLAGGMAIFGAIVLFILYVRGRKSL